MSYWIRAYNIVQEHMPKWVVVKSFAVFLLSIAIFFFVVLLLPFQDKVGGKIIIYSSGKPISLLAPQSGRLHLYAEEGQAIKRGDILGTIEYDSSPEQINAIRSFVFTDILAPTPKKISAIKEKLELLITDDSHELNTALIALYDALDQYNRSIRSQAPEREIVATRALQNSYASRLPDLESTAALFNQSIGLLKEQLSQDSILHLQGGLSKRAYEMRKMQLYEDLRSQLDIISEQKKIKALIADQDASVAALQDLYSRNSDQLFDRILNQIQVVREVFNTTIRNNVIIAPSPGQFALQPSTVQYADVALNEVIGSLITRRASNRELAITQLKSKNRGKIKTGMKVNIYLDEYPAREYGIIYGTVAEVRENPTQEEAELFVSLNLPIETSYNRTLPLQKTYSGTAEVVIDRLNLLQILTREIKYSREKLIASQ